MNRTSGICIFIQLYNLLKLYHKPLRPQFAFIEQNDDDIYLIQGPPLTCQLLEGLTFNLTFISIFVKKLREVRSEKLGEIECMNT